MNSRDRKIVLTVAVAAIGAVFTEHLLRPQLKRKLKVK